MTNLYIIANCANIINEGRHHIFWDIFPSVSVTKFYVCFTFLIQHSLVKLMNTCSFRKLSFPLLWIKKWNKTLVTFCTCFYQLVNPTERCEKKIPIWEGNKKNNTELSDRHSSKAPRLNCT